MFSASFSHDGGLLATAGPGKSALMWDARRGKSGQAKTAAKSCYVLSSCFPSPGLRPGDGHLPDLAAPPRARQVIQGFEDDALRSRRTPEAAFQSIHLWQRLITDADS